MTAISLNDAHISEEVTGMSTDDGFQKGFVRGYRTAVTMILHKERPPSTRPDGRDGFDSGFNRGFRAAEDDITKGRPLQHCHLGPLP